MHEPIGWVRMGHMQAALLSSNKMDWQTPDEVLELVRKVGPIGLDPRTAPDNPTGAGEFYYLGGGVNGLVEPWLVPEDEVCFVNPPYGRELPKWTCKIAAEAAVCYKDHYTLLVPARPDTRWFQDDVCKANEILFWKGRMKFKGAKDQAPFPTLLAYWGPDSARFREAFTGRGVFASELCR